MGLNRFFIDKDFQKNLSINIDNEEAIHIKNVLRKN